MKVSSRRGRVKLEDLCEVGDGSFMITFLSLRQPLIEESFCVRSWGSVAIYRSTIAIGVWRKRRYFPEN
jgi:hypothetical protein